MNLPIDLLFFLSLSLFFSKLLMLGQGDNALDSFSSFFFLSAHRIPPSIPPTFALYYPEIICFGLETACWKEGPCTGVTDSGIERGNVQVSLV